MPSADDNKTLQEKKEGKGGERKGCGGEEKREISKLNWDMYSSTHRLCHALKISIFAA
jgi:hypothetical protein